jgi:hypothetical protein
MSINNKMIIQHKPQQRRSGCDKRILFEPLYHLAIPLLIRHFRGLNMPADNYAVRMHLSF